LTPNNRKVRTIIIYVVIFALLMAFASMLFNIGPKNTYKYYEVISFFDEGKIENFTLDLGSGEMIFRLRGEDKDQVYLVPNVGLFVDDISEVVREYNREHPDAPIKDDYDPIKETPWWLSLLPSLLMMGIFIAFWFYMMNNGGVGKANNFGKAKSHRVETDHKTTFANVAGADEEKEELWELVEFLRNPQKFNELGARIPKGVLLMGPPGTGKTLLARAVAGEAGVPFFSISGSDFVEMFVGVGASRVRDLFDQAKKESPSIIFIDEIDAVGRHRGAGLGGGHDEREQTLNQLLVEMDGFDTNSGVIVIAATNRNDILDPALLRPGRFDRQVVVGYPDIKGREAILKVHARNKPLGPDVLLSTIAATTAGFTGADLENLLNEAALLAARAGRKAIMQADMEAAMIKVVAGPEKRSRVISEKERKITAYHEAGHAVVTYYCATQDPVHQVSIIPRGMMGGFTMHLPSEDRSYALKGHMQEEIAVLLAGRVAEQLTLDDISTGASNDIERATKTAHSMVTRYGFSEKLGPILYGQEHQEVFLGRDISSGKSFSENVAAEIDAEVRRLVEEGYADATRILTEHIDQLRLVAEALLIRETITGEEFRQLMEEGRIIIEKEEKPAAEPSAAEPSAAESSAAEEIPAEQEAPAEVQEQTPAADENEPKTEE